MAKPNQALPVHERFRNARRAVALTQSQLAKKARIAQSKLSVFENGYIRLSDSELKRIADVLEAAGRGNKSSIRFHQLTNLGKPDSEVLPGPEPKLDPALERKLLREQLSLSRQELARRANLTVAKVRTWELKGESALPREEVLALMNVMGAAQSQQYESDPWQRLDSMTRVATDYYGEKQQSAQQVADLRKIIDVQDEMIQHYKEGIAELQSRIAELEKQLAEEKKKAASGVLV